MRHRRPVHGLPWGLIGAIALVMLGERTVERHALDLTELSAVNWSYSKRAARSIAPKTDILCLGTSLTKFGILPRSIEAATGRRAYNLATCNSHMPTTYYLLKRALDAGARPTAILVDCQDGPVTAEDREKQAEALRVNLRNWPELLSLGECLDLSWYARDATFFFSTSLAKAIPSYKCRHEIRNVVIGAIEGRDASARANNILFLRNWNANLGTGVIPLAITIKANEQVPERRREPVPDRFAEGQWSRNLLTELYMRRFFALAAARDIPVFWLIPPVPPPVVASREQEGFDRYYWSLAHQAQQIYPRVTVIDGSQSAYAPDMFCDKVHMNAKGAVVFSENVASIVARSLARGDGGPGWVELPRCDASQIRSSWALEDVNASRTALEEGRIGLRR